MKDLLIRNGYKSSPPRRGCFRLLWRFLQGHHVFPASAGVFLSFGTWGVLKLGLPRLGGGVSPNRLDVLFPPDRLPRLGGGVSKFSAAEGNKKASSPPRRGCFSCAYVARYVTKSLPRLGGGVSWKAIRLSRPPLSLPRLGGGVSQEGIPTKGLTKSSPPRRGCFLQGPPPRLGS